MILGILVAVVAFLVYKEFKRSKDE